MLSLAGAVLFRTSDGSIVRWLSGNGVYRFVKSNHPNFDDGDLMPEDMESDLTPANRLAELVVAEAA